MVNLLSYNVSAIVAIGKYIVLYNQRYVLASIIEIMAEDWSTVKSQYNKKIMMNEAKIGRILAFISILYAPLIVFLHILVTTYLKPEKLFLYGSTPTIASNLMWPSYFPFNTSRNYIFEITWICQITATMFTSLVYGTFDTFMTVLVLHLCSQLAIVRNQLKNLYNVNKHPAVDKLVAEKLRDIVKRHEYLINLAETIEKTFTLILLPQLICYPLIFCFQGYAMLTSMAKTQVSSLQILYYLSYDTYTLYHLFIFCWIGEHLYNESTKIGYAYYESLWYNHSFTHAYSLMIIGYRALRPLHITAGKFARFSLGLFVSIIKTSMGYLNLLRAVQSHGY
ncbi:odorant receptor 4-like isoform X2 [Microplitis mediator]|nr:odorant receptor 4-like isoform X2 [Microplitis mediator]